MQIIFKDVSVVKNKGCTNMEKKLDNLTFDIKKSGIYAFVGNSKSGKTTICELIDFLNKPHKGLIKVGKYTNLDLRKDYNKLRFDVGYVFSNPDEMFITNKVSTELAFGMKYFKYKYQTKNKRVLDSLKLLGLSDFYLDKKLDELSLSEKRKVSIASVLSFNPKILVLDEPTIGLNMKEKKELIKLLKLMKNRYNKIIIITTKDTDFVYSFVDYVYLLHNGKKVKEGTKDIMHDVKLMKEIDLSIPKIVEFVNEANLKNMQLNYYTDISDLAKGVYRNVNK